jgi:hypothetical protein
MHHMQAKATSPTVLLQFKSQSSQRSNHSSGTSQGSYISALLMQTCTRVIA